MLSDNDTNFLKQNLSFWDKLNANEESILLNNVSLLNYEQGYTIHNSETSCIGVLLVKSGILRVYILSENGKEVTLYRLYKDDVCILSASCLIKNITFDIHIDAETNSEVLAIDNSSFAKISNQNIYVENFSYKTATDKFSNVMWVMEQILFMSFDKRLAIFLIDEISKNKSDTITLTHEQIAKYMGSAREVVSRMLKYFKNEGIVELSRNSIKVINKPKLKSLL